MILSRGFVRKAMDLPNTLAQRFEQRRAPSVRGEGSGPLIGLLVRLGQKSHRRIGGIHVLSNCDYELHFTVRLLLLHGELVQLAQLIGRILLRMVPFGQCRFSSAKPNYTSAGKTGGCW